MQKTMKTIAKWAVLILDGVAGLLEFVAMSLAVAFLMGFLFGLPILAGLALNHFFHFLK